MRDALLGRPIVDVDLAVDGDAHAAAEAIRRRHRRPDLPAVATRSAPTARWRPDRSWMADLTPLQGADDRGRPGQPRLRDQRDRGAAARRRAGRPERRPGATWTRRLLRVLPGAYERDPLRPAAARRGWRPSSTWRPTRRPPRPPAQAAPRITEAAAERVFAELRRLVLADRVLDGLDLADDLGIVARDRPGAGRPPRRRAEQLPPRRRPRPHARGAPGADRARAGPGARVRRVGARPACRARRARWATS